MNSDFFATLPLDLIYDEQYSSLSARAVILYSLFLNRKKLSANNKGFHDSNGIFIYYSISQICNHLHCTKNSARSVIHELEQTGLIRKEYQQNGLPLKIYVNDIRNSEKSIRNFAPKASQNKSYCEPTNSSSDIQKSATNDFSQKEKAVSFDVDIPLTQIQINRRSFGEMKSRTKKKKTENGSQSSY